MIFEYSNYRDYLRSNLVERISKNSSYSLRAMAQHLGLSPSSLSEVIKGKRNLSLAKAAALANKLGLKGKEAEYFCLLVQIEHTADPIIKESVQNRIQILNPQRKSHNLSLDLFKLIADWYHTAILHLAEVDGFEVTPQEISKRIGISVFEAATAIERLERLELLKKEDGKYIKLNGFYSESPIPNDSLRRFHKQTLEKAIESLQTQTPKEKIIRSETFAIDPALLPQADELMEEFVAKLLKLFAQSKKKTEVYHLGIQLFNFVKKGRSS